MDQTTAGAAHIIPPFCVDIEKDILKVYQLRRQELDTAVAKHGKDSVEIIPVIQRVLSVVTTAEQHWVWKENSQNVCMTLYDWLVDLHTKAFGTDHPTTLCFLLSRCTYNAHFIAADEKVILSDFRRVVGLFESRYGPDDLNICTALEAQANYLGSGELEGEQHFRQAEEIYLRILSIRDKHHIADNIETADILADLANVSSLADERRQRILRAIGIYERHYGVDTLRTAAIYQVAGYLLQGDFQEEAEQYLRRAVDIQERFYPESLDFQAGMVNLYAFYARNEAPWELMEARRRAITVYERVHGPDHENTKAARQELAALKSGILGVGYAEGDFEGRARSDN